MPKHVKAQDEQEERTVRKLAKSYHAPADWKFHAKTGGGKLGRQDAPSKIAADLECHPQTVRIHLARFNAEGIAGLGMRPELGHKPRLTERERSRILGLVKQWPPGRLEMRADETMVARDEHGSAKFCLDALAQATKEAGIQVKRSQIRRIFLREGVGFRQTHSWGTSHDPDFAAI